MVPGPVSRAAAVCGACCGTHHLARPYARRRLCDPEPGRTPVLVAPAVIALEPTRRRKWMMAAPPNPIHPPARSRQVNTHRSDPFTGPTMHSKHRPPAPAGVCRRWPGRHTPRQSQLRGGDHPSGSRWGPSSRPPPVARLDVRRSPSPARRYLRPDRLSHAPDRRQCAPRPGRGPITMREQKHRVTWFPPCRFRALRDHFGGARGCAQRSRF